MYSTALLVVSSIVLDGDTVVQRHKKGGNDGEVAGWRDEGGSRLASSATRKPPSDPSLCQGSR